MSFNLFSFVSHIVSFHSILQDHQVTEYHPSHHHFHRPNTSLQFDTMVGSIVQSRCSFSSWILETALIAFMPMLAPIMTTTATRTIRIVISLRRLLLP